MGSLLGPVLGICLDSMQLPGVNVAGGIVISVDCQEDWFVKDSANYRNLIFSPLHVERELKTFSFSGARFSVFQQLVSGCEADCEAGLEGLPPIWLRSLTIDAVFHLLCVERHGQRRGPR